MMFIRIYKKSFLATLISLIGSVLMYSGIGITIGGMLAGILLSGLGLGIFLLAVIVNEKKLEKLRAKCSTSSSTAKRDFQLS